MRVFYSCRDVALTSDIIFTCLAMRLLIERDICGSQMAEVIKIIFIFNSIAYPCKSYCLTLERIFSAMAVYLFAIGIMICVVMCIRTVLR